MNLFVPKLLKERMQTKALFLNHRRNKEKLIHSSLSYQRDEQKQIYLFLNYWRNEDEPKYSFLNYQWFDIATQKYGPLFKMAILNTRE